MKIGSLVNIKDYDWGVIKRMIIYLGIPVITMCAFYIDSQKTEEFYDYVYSFKTIDYVVQGNENSHYIAEFAHRMGYIQFPDLKETVRYIEARNSFIRYGTRRGDIVKIPIIINIKSNQKNHFSTYQHKDLKGSFFYL